MSGFAERVSRFASTPGFKFFLVATLVLILAIPMAFVWYAVSDRGSRAAEVERNVATSWGGRQVITGPYLIIPFTRIVTDTIDGKPRERTERGSTIYLPDRLDVAVEFDTQELQRSIFRVPAYRAKVSFDVDFPEPEENAPTGTAQTMEYENAFVALSISDVRALRSQVALAVEGRGDRDFEPSLGLVPPATNSRTRSRLQSGINARLGPGVASRPFTVRFDLDIAGSKSFSLAPAGRETQVRMTAGWPDPSFFGSFLPVTREVRTDGFEAEWQIPHLARSVPQVWEWGGGSIGELEQSAFGVRFYQPVDLYKVVDRALKYALMFIAVTFLTVFAIEMAAGVRIHAVQYIFVGLALLVFYLLLLALAERFGFVLAYVAAAAATMVLISGYVASVVGRPAHAAIVFGFLFVLYAFLYLVLRLEDHAFLAGAIFGFVVLATVMFATRRVEWSRATTAADRP